MRLVQGMVIGLSVMLLAGCGQSEGKGPEATVKAFFKTAAGGGLVAAGKYLTAGSIKAIRREFGSNASKRLKDYSRGFKSARTIMLKGNRAVVAVVIDLLWDNDPVTKKKVQDAALLFQSLAKTTKDKKLKAEFTAKAASLKKGEWHGQARLEKKGQRWFINLSQGLKPR